VWLTGYFVSIPAMHSAPVLDIGVPAGLSDLQQEYRRHRVR